MAKQMEIRTNRPKAIKYLRQQRVRARAYSDVYYDYKRWWMRTFYLIMFVIITINAGNAFVSLTVIESATAAKIVGGTCATLAGALSTVITVLNPARREKDNEHAGDDYKLLNDDLERYDDTMSMKRLQKLVNNVGSRVKKLTMSYDEPSRQAVQRRLRQIREQLQKCEEYERKLNTLSDDDDESDSDNGSGGGGSAVMSKRTTTVQDIGYMV